MKKKKYLISLIIACYNTEKYVEKCLNSVFSQTQKNIQVIIIEDGSTDNTKKVLKKYLSKIDNKDVIFIENETNFGLAKSRNIGLEHATGEYIGFIDSDDYISDNYYEEMYKAIEKDKSDIAIVDMNIVYENEGNRSVLSKVCEGKKDKLDFINNGLAASACNKLIKRELIVKYPFPEGKLNEDVAVIIPCIVNAKKISYVESVQYNYVQREKSIQNSSISNKRFDVFDVVDLCLERIKDSNKFEEYKDAIIYQQIIMFFLYVIPKESSFIKRDKILKKFYKLSKKYELRKNNNYHKFIINQGKKHQYYYKTLMKLNSNGLSLPTNLLISLYRTYAKVFIKPVVKRNITFNDLISCAKKQSKMKDNKIKISVVVPNYNYEKFLVQRIYSILNQKVKIYELIILDDCSKDKSIDLINVIYDKISKYINVKKVYNDINSGSAFKQWEKGFNMATGDYVWIAEADDYCDENLLKSIVKPLYKDRDIVISYSDTAFIDINGKIIIRTIKPEIDIMKTGHWDKSYINSGKDEIKNYSFLNCTIANVSSALIKKDNYDEFFKMSGEYKQAGDWLFYVNVMNKGKIAYYNKPLNYYRVHGNNVSSIMKKQAHIDEIKKIHKYFDKKFTLDKKQKKEIEKRYDFLNKAWNLK